jgi:hypothetical protein
MQFDHVGIEGCMLINKLIMALRHPSLSVDLPAVASRLLLLLISFLLILRELHSWLRHCHSYHDRRDGLKG